MHEKQLKRFGFSSHLDWIYVVFFIAQVIGPSSAITSFWAITVEVPRCHPHRNLDSKASLPVTQELHPISSHVLTDQEPNVSYTLSQLIRGHLAIVYLETFIHLLLDLHESNSVSRSRWWNWITAASREQRLKVLGREHDRTIDMLIIYIYGSNPLQLVFIYVNGCSWRPY